MIREFTTESGIRVSVGKNAKGNDYLCRMSESDEYWLHLQGDSSPHAIVHNHIEDEDDLKFAAQLVKRYSKHSNKKRVSVIYCKVGDVKVTKELGCVKLLTTPDLISI